MSDAGQPEPTGTSSKKTKSRWIMGATAVVVILAGGLAIGTRYANDIPWPLGKESSAGTIIVGTPDIYTRERLINARLREQDWLEEQFKLTHFDNPDDANRDRFAYLHFKAKQSKASAKSLSVETANQAESAPGRRIGTPIEDTDGRPPDNDLSFELPTAIQYEALRAFRNRVEQEWLETQLDDRHDIAGNTIYELAFDVALLVPPRERKERIKKIALISVIFGRENELEGSRLYELWQDWRAHLEPIVQSAVENRKHTFFPEHGRTFASPSEIASLIKLLEESLTSDPYSQAILKKFFNLSNKEHSDKYNIYENREMRRNLLLKYTKEYRTHVDRIRSYNDMQEFVGNFIEFCLQENLLQSKKIKDKKFSEVYLNKKIFTLPKDCSYLSEEIRAEFRTKVNEKYAPNRMPDDPYAGYRFGYDPLPASLRGVRHQVLSFFCKPAQKSPPTSIDLVDEYQIAQKTLCNGSAPGNSFSPSQTNRSLDPLLALLTARNIVWANKPDMDKNDGRFFPFSSLYDDGWRSRTSHGEPQPEWVLKEIDSRERAIDNTVTYFENLNSTLDGIVNIDPDIFLDNTESENIESAVFRQCSYDKSAARSLFLCPPLPPLDRSREIAIAALVKEDLINKGLGRFFHIELANCEHEACFLRLNELGKHAWPEKQHYDACVKAEIDAARSVGEGCRLLASTAQFNAFKFFRDRLMSGNEVYAYDVKGETVQVGMRTRQWSDKMALSMSLADSTAGTASALLDFMDSGKEQLADENQEVVGFSFAVDLKEPRPSRKKSNSSNRNTRIDSDRRAIFGWMISPVPLVQGGIRKYPVSALVSAPSWWRAATLQIGTCWIAIDKVGGLVRGHLSTEKKRLPRRRRSDGDSVSLSDHAIKLKIKLEKACGQSGNFTWREHNIRLPGDELNISHKLRIQVVDEPNLQGIGLDSLPDGSFPDSQLGVMAGKPANIVLLGDRLWRNPRVFLGTQMADLVQVLPDMTGLVANFRCIEKPIEFATVKKRGRGSREQQLMTARDVQEQRSVHDENEMSRPSVSPNQSLRSMASGQEHQDSAGPSAPETVTRSLRIWTSEGSTRTAPIPVFPFSPDASEPPCYVHDLLDEEDIKEIVKRSFEAAHTSNPEAVSNAAESTAAHGAE